MPPPAREPEAPELEVQVDLDVDGDSDSSVVAPGAPAESEERARERGLGALLRSAAERLELDDHSGALALIERVLASDPASETALELKSRCEATLLAMLESKLGDLARRPRLQMKSEEIVWLNLDHRAGFLLSQIDGTVSIDDLFALSGMGRLETAQILVMLLHEKVIR